MNTVTATLPRLFPALRIDRAHLGQWAFAAAVRMSDQNRPLGLKLIIECMMLIRSLTQLLRAARDIAPAAARGRTTRSAHAAVARAVARPARRHAETSARTAATRHSVRNRHSGATARRRVRPSACWSPHDAMGCRSATDVLHESGFLCMVGLNA